MKTRSQTKKENLERDQEKIPQLNEDVMGIILKHVFRMETNEILKSFEIIKEHYCQFLHPDDGPDIMIIARSSNHVEWPNYLNSNSRRLVHYTKAKLLWNHKLSFHQDFGLYVRSKKELDLLWKTFKHFRFLHLSTDDEDDYEIRMSFYFRLILRRIRLQGTLFEKLEKTRGSK